ncbi:MAG: hypothetical protein ACFFG0_00970 [Candidatus Thorarchaeota archaeon]
MVYGINISTCGGCGKPIICGDCIDFFCNDECEKVWKEKLKKLGRDIEKESDDA